MALSRSSLLHARLPRSAARATALLVAGSAALALGGPGSISSDTAPASAPTAVSVRVATFNMLGHSHTVASGNKPSYAEGPIRTTWALRLFRENGLSVIGLQEFEPKQYDRFRAEGASTWAIYPGLGHPDVPIRGLANSIIWRRDTWRRLDAGTINVPYFRGNPWPMPYVLLENRHSGERAWFFNSHNPADARGPAEDHRQRGFALEGDLMNRLRADGTPVFSLGDKNSKDRYICPVSTRVPGAHSANDARVENGQCLTPQRLWIDWIVGTEDVAFDNFTALRSDLVRKTSDHPLFWADATLAAAPAAVPQASGDALLIAVEGLRSSTLRAGGAGLTPHLHELKRRGAMTWNARTTYERTTNLPNLVSMLTGRAVATSDGGHGVYSPGTAATVHEAAGRYVSSVFDLTHNLGLHTSMVTSRPGQRIIDTSWDADSGGRDPYGTDDGPDKIDDFVVRSTDTGVVSAAADLLARPDTGLSVVQFSETDKIGQRYGFTSTRYRSALRRLDTRVGRLLAAIEANPARRGRTLVLVTGTHGGDGRSHTDPSRVNNFKVPYFAAGPGVPAGSGIYGLNRDLRFPWERRVAYSATTQPFRTAYTPRLITDALGIPRVPGTTLGRSLDITVSGG